jgi:hypothetical protein
MDPIFSQKSARNAVLPLTVYSALLLLMFMLEKIAPSGPCTPGPAVFIILFLPVACAGLLILDLAAIKFKDKSRGLSLILNILALLIFIIIYLYYHFS